MQQLMLRAGANYKFNNTFSAYLGYAYFNTDATFDVDGGDASEHRIVEDLNINYKHSKFGIAHRIRLEHRFFTNDTRHWIRYQLGVNHPISDKLSAYVYDEVFLNFQGNTYSQNWFGIGVKHKLSNTVKLQLGYHNISLNGGANFNRIIAGISISTNHLKNK
jgi:long-subunit fatty acid transport protein